MNLKPDASAAEYGAPNRVPVADMMFEIENQSFAVGAALDRVLPQVRAIVRENLRDYRHLYLTGCGDSLYAGMAAKMAFHRLAKVPTEAVEAMEFGRYTTDVLPPGSLVVGISNSGKATRTIEAVRCGGDAGALTVAVTGDASSRLALASHLLIDQRVERDGRALTMPSNLDSQATRPSFGLANYLVSATTLMALAAEWGRARATIADDEADEFLDRVRRSAGTLQKTVDNCVPAVVPLARRLAEDPDRQLVILGAGPALAVALFYGAKTYELARVNGVVQQLEEWAHEQFFLCGPQTELLLIAPEGRSSGRAREIASTASQLGAHVTVVTDASSASAWSEHDVVEVAGTVDEELVGIPYVVPGEILATQIARMRNKDAFQFDSELQYVLNMTTIQKTAEYRLLTPTAEGRQ